LRTGRPVRHAVVGVVRRDSSGSASGPPRRWLLVNCMPLGRVGGTDNPTTPPALGGWSERSGRQVEAAAHPPHRASTGAVTTVSDTSAYVQAREAIRTSEERYRGLVESLPLMLIQTDRSMRLTSVNPATAAITGYQLHEITDPAAWAVVLHPDDLPRAQ